MASRTINIPATTNLDADELTSGTVPFARLSTGSGSTQVAVGDHTHTAAVGDRRARRQGRRPGGSHREARDADSAAGHLGAVRGGRLRQGERRSPVHGEPDRQGVGSDHLRRQGRLLDEDAATVAELDAWHSHCRVAGLALGSRITTTSFVFSRDNRGTVPWWPDTVSDRWRALADDVGLHGVRLHDLRHTMVSTLTEAGFDPRVIADRAGHTQITTTLGVYAHARPARDQDLAAHLAAQLDAG